jgi:hypothetical protein
VQLLSTLPRSLSKFKNPPIPSRASRPRQISSPPPPSLHSKQSRWCCRDKKARTSAARHAVSIAALTPASIPPPPSPAALRLANSIAPTRRRDSARLEHQLDLFLTEDIIGVARRFETHHVLKIELPRAIKEQSHSLEPQPLADIRWRDRKLPPTLPKGRRPPRLDLRLVPQRLRSEASQSLRLRAGVVRAVANAASAIKKLLQSPFFEI